MFFIFSYNCVTWARNLTAPIATDYPLAVRADLQAYTSLFQPLLHVPSAVRILIEFDRCVSEARVAGSLEIFCQLPAKLSNGLLVFPFVDEIADLIRIFLAIVEFDGGTPPKTQFVESRLTVTHDDRLSGAVITVSVFFHWMAGAFRYTGWPAIRFKVQHKEPLISNSVN